MEGAERQGLEIRRQFAGAARETRTETAWRAYSMKTWLSGGVLQQNQRENRNVPIVNFMDTGHLALPGIWTSVSTEKKHAMTD